MSISRNLINYIALQAAQKANNGLYHGRMGIVLSLYCYGKVQEDKRLCDYAKDVLQTSTGDYHDGVVGLENGLAGLGLGFTLLYKAGMFKDDLNDLLFEIDTKIMRNDPRRISDFSFREGAAGVFYYIKMRKTTGQECLSIDKDYIAELEHSISLHTDECELSETLLSCLTSPKWEVEDYLDKEVEIDNGSAYFLIQNSYDKIFSRQ